MTDDHESRERATQRGESIRAVLMAQLVQGGPATAAQLHEFLPTHVSLSEVAFQLDRLSEEGKVSGEQGGVYRAI